MRKLTPKEKALIKKKKALRKKIRDLEKKVNNLDWAAAIQRHREILAHELEALRKARVKSMQLAHTRWMD